ncbi:MAG: lactate utilization protein [Vallitalea sp.]|jgi:L-lactate utilization protein LutB|nr:lactate utilization protein [Vallitalea sp.]
MNKFVDWKNRKKANKIINILNDKGYNAILAENLDDAKDIVLNSVEKGSSVAVGGSVTLSTMGLVEHFRNGDYKFFERYKQPTWEETVEVYRQSMLADYLVTGTNVITENGELVNRDSSGNRAAGVVFGPKKVVIVCGINKVVPTLDDAFKRLREIAPMNCERVGHNTPCRETGECEDCQIQQRMCNYTTIVHNGRKFENRITIVIIPEHIGF